MKKNTIKKENLIKKLRQYFKGVKGVSAAFLFGSFSKGRQASLSDVDIAVYLEDVKLEDKIWLELERLLHKEVDLVILNKAIPIIAWAAIKKGSMLFIKDKKFYLDLVLKFSCEAEDFIEFNLDFFKRREKLYGY